LAIEFVCKTTLCWRLFGGIFWVSTPKEEEEAKAKQCFSLFSFSFRLDLLLVVVVAVVYLYDINFSIIYLIFLCNKKKEIIKIISKCWRRPNEKKLKWFIFLAKKQKGNFYLDCNFLGEKNLNFHLNVLFNLLFS